MHKEMCPRFHSRKNFPVTFFPRDASRSEPPRRYDSNLSLSFRRYRDISHPRKIRPRRERGVRTIVPILALGFSHSAPRIKVILPGHEYEEGTLSRDAAEIRRCASNVRMYIRICNHTSAGEETTRTRCISAPRARAHARTYVRTRVFTCAVFTVMNRAESLEGRLDDAPPPGRRRHIEERDDTGSSLATLYLRVSRRFEINRRRSNIIPRRDI